MNDRLVHNKYFAVGNSTKGHSLGLAIKLKYVIAGRFDSLRYSKDYVTRLQDLISVQDGLITIINHNTVNKTEKLITTTLLLQSLWPLTVYL